MCLLRSALRIAGKQSGGGKPGGLGCALVSRDKDAIEVGRHLFCHREPSRWFDARAQQDGLGAGCRRMPGDGGAVPDAGDTDAPRAALQHTVLADEQHRERIDWGNHAGNDDRAGESFDDVATFTSRPDAIGKSIRRHRGGSAIRVRRFVGVLGNP